MSYEPYEGSERQRRQRRRVRLVAILLAVSLLIPMVIATASAIRL